MLVVFQTMTRRGAAIIDSDVLFGFRLRLLDLARESGVSRACRVFGIHRSTYYRWKGMVERSGLEMLRPREHRLPRMPNQLSPVVEGRILAFSIAHPGLGPREGWQRPSPKSAGVASWSVPMASGGCSGDTASPGVSADSVWWPVTPRRPDPSGRRPSRRVTSR